LRAVLFKFNLLFFCFASLLSAQSRTNLENISLDSRKTSLVVCSQNLKNYSGEPLKKIAGKLVQAEPNAKEKDLIKRFMKAECDVIGLQELVGSTNEIAAFNLDRLAEILKISTSRRFISKIGDVNENSQRNAFLVAADKAQIINTVTYRRLLLPKLDNNQKPRQFTRSPLEIQISVDGKDGRLDKNISILNLHFKSKSGSKDDPAALQWETYRMEMAEGIRRVLENRFKNQMEAGEPVILLGDRNAHFDTASARILEGSLVIEDFKEKGRCRLTKRGTPICQGNIRQPVKFFSVITNDPETAKLPGTFVYNKVFSFLDDILVNPQAVVLFRENIDKEGNYNSGIINGYQEASDHALVWSKLSW
jgi:hypothetical protein